MSTFTGLVVPADGDQSMYLFDFTDYTQIQTKVGGTFTVVDADLGGVRLSVYVNDEGLYVEPLVLNPVATLLTEQHLFGDAVIAGDVDPQGEQLDVPLELRALFLVRRQ